MPACLRNQTSALLELLLHLGDGGGSVKPGAYVEWLPEEREPRE